MNIQQNRTPIQDVFFIYDPTCSLNYQGRSTHVARVPEKITIKPEKDRYENVLIVRYAGFGDLLILTPALKGLKEKYPGIKITILTSYLTSEILYNNLYVDNIINCILPEFTSLMRNRILENAYDQIWDLTGSIGGSVRAEYENVYDITCQLLDVKPSSMKPIVVMADEEINIAKQVLINEGIGEDDKIIVIHCEASSGYRRWPVEYVRELSIKLVKEGFKVVLIGKLSREFNFETIEGVTSLVDKLPVRISMALLKLPQVKLLVAPDSIFTHCSNSFDLKTVGLYGAVNPYSYQKYHKNLWVIEGNNCPLIPCSNHGKAWHCEAECMQSITSDKVLNEIMTVLNGKEACELRHSYLPKQMVCPICNSQADIFARKGESFWYKCPVCLFMQKDIYNNEPDINVIFDGNKEIELPDASQSNINIIQPFPTGRFSYKHINSKDGTDYILSPQSISILAKKAGINVEVLGQHPTNITFFVRRNI